MRRRAERAGLVNRGRTAAAAGLPGTEGRELRTASDQLAQFSHDIELARVSKDMYRDPSEGRPLLGWTRMSDSLDQLPTALRDPKLWRDDVSGFAAGLYHEAPELGGRTVLAYRGTANAAGWATDAVQGLGLPTVQYHKAYNVASAVREQFGPSVLVTGHSLGGGQATLASATTGAHGATFNPAGLHPATAADYNTRPSAAADRLNAYHVPGEALTTLQSVPGRALLDPIADALKRGLITGRAVSDFRLPTAREWEAARIPPSIGRHVTLPNPGGPPADPFPSSPFARTNPVAGAAAAVHGALTSGLRHTGIFAVHGMELQKEQDRATIERLAPAGVSARRP